MILTNITKKLLLGSKTAQLIEALHVDENDPIPSGFVVANDVRFACSNISQMFYLCPSISQKGRQQSLLYVSSPSKAFEFSVFCCYKSRQFLLARIQNTRGQTNEV